MLSGSTAALGEAEAAAGTVAVAEVSAGMMNLKASTMADCMSHSDPCCGAATVELASPDPGVALCTCPVLMPASAASLSR